MCFATLLPLGLLQLYESVNDGYFEARELNFLTNAPTRCSSGCGCPATSSSSSAACLPFLWIAWLGAAALPARSTTHDAPGHRCSPRCSRRVPRSARSDRDARPSTTSVWLVAGTARFLLAVALRLRRDGPARRGARAAWRTGGFRYHADHDAWVCPQDQWLWPTSFDPRAPPRALPRQARRLQRLPAQGSCTTSARPRDHPADRPVAALGSRALPPRHRLYRSR